MKKIVSIIISVLLITNILGSCFITNAAETISHQELVFDSEAFDVTNYDDVKNSETTDLEETFETVSLHQTFNKENHQTSELISIQYELRNYLGDVTTVYVSNGFSVVGEIINSVDPDLKCQTFNITLAYDGVLENPCFLFEVVTEEGMTFCAKLYAYLSNHGLFISKNSFDSAKELSYYYLVESGQLTITEFNEILHNEYSKLGNEAAQIINYAELTAPISQIVEPLQVTQNITTVQGTLSWIDDMDISHPMQYNKVEVWDAFCNELVGTVYTNASGEYSYSYADTHVIGNIYIKVYAGGANSIVKTENGVSYVYTSGIQVVPQGGIANVDWNIDMTSDLGRAFQISQAINVSTEYVREMNGTYIAPITVKYPHTIEDKECFYSPSADTIFICGEPTTAKLHEPYASWDVIMHEYGHHVQEELGVTDSPGGRHTISENLADKNDSKDVGIRLAWGESYASVFGGMAQAYYASSLQNIDTVGDAAYEAYNLVWLNYESTNVKKGEACEASIIGVLWDLYDTVSESHDTISFSHQDYWDMITNSGATTLSEFCNYFINTYPTSYDLALGKLLSHYKMSVSDFTVNTSGATPSFSWTANGTSSDLQNNKFDLVVFDENYNELLRKVDLLSTSYTLSAADRNIVFDSEGTTYYAIIIAYQISSPATGGYYSGTLSFAKPEGYQHQHVYSCVYLNNLLHQDVCACGETGGTGRHYVTGGNGINRFVPCAGCGYLLDMRDDIHEGIMSITQVSVNGSYIRSDGIVVLVDEDIEAYLAGTLQFYHPEDVPVTQ